MSHAPRAPIFGIGVAAIVIPLTTIVSHTFGRSTYPLLLPAIKDDVLETNTVAGVGGTIIFLAYLLGVIVVTAVAGRFEPMAILRGGLVCSIVGLALLGVATSVGVVYAGLFLSSAGGAGIWITAPGLASDEVRPERRGLVIGFLTASVGLGTSLLALGTRAARTAADDPSLWRPVYLVEAGVAAVILVAVVVLVRSRSTSATGKGISLSALRQLADWRRITVAYMTFGAIAAGYSSFLAEVMEEDGGLTRAQVADVYVLMGFASLLAAPFMGWVSDRVGRRQAKTAVMVALMVGAGVVAIGDRWSIVVSVLLIGGMWASYPTLTATYVRDHLDARAFGSAYGTMTIFYALSAVGAPAAVGVLADARGDFTLAYLAIAALAAMGAGILLSIRPARS